MQDQFISIATVSAAQGLDGKIKVFPLSDRPERFLELPGKDILWKRGDEIRNMRIDSSRPFGKFYVMAVSGITDRSQAQEIVGGELVVAESDVMPLPDGTYYIYQLVGLTVHDETHGILGSVKEVLQPGSNDVYVVEGRLGQVLIPALKDVVLHIDIKQGTMRVNLPLGLIDSDES